MPVIKRIHKHGSDITIEAHAEVLFTPGEDVDRWMRSFVARLRRNTEAFAPSNKRPRWSHYGPALKRTIKTARTKRRIFGRDTMAIYGAVGSTAPYSTYVNEGTGIYGFGGGAPYLAKIIPPWGARGYDLYEHTWRPGGPGHPRVAPVFIKGQKPQQFFNRALETTFDEMRLQRKFGGKVTQLPQYLLTDISDDLFGNTPADQPFIRQLEEWRKGRDQAWGEARNLGGKPGVLRKREAVRLLAGQRREALREGNRRPRSKRTGRRLPNYQTAAAKRAAEWRRKNTRPKVSKEAFTAEFVAKKKAALIRKYNKMGYIYVRSVFIERDGTWSISVRKRANEPWTVKGGKWK